MIVSKEETKGEEGEWTSLFPYCLASEALLFAAVVGACCVDFVVAAGSVDVED